jgi:hypothetical protein
MPAPSAVAAQNKSQWDTRKWGAPATGVEDVQGAPRNEMQIGFCRDPIT